MWGSICLVIYLIFSSANIHAEPAFQFHTLDKQHGLASSVVYDIVQDQEGFMWFATEDGLQKYDGFEFVNYRHSRNNNSTLSSNIVRTLMIDRRGRLWVGTDNGLDLYRKKSDDFIRMSSIPINHEQPNYRVRSLYQTEDDKIWLGSTFGLSEIDPISFKVVDYPFSKVRTIFEDERKRLWVGTLGEGLHYFDRNKKAFRENNSVYSKEGNSIDSLSSTSVMDIYNDSFGRILIATWGKGVFQLRKNSRKLIRYELSLPNDQVRTIHQDEESQLWFGTQNGILIQNTIEKSVRVIDSRMEDGFSAKISSVSKIFQARDETLWVSTTGSGVSRHLPASRKFESFGINPSEGLGLIDPVVFVLSENIRGNVWIGTESGMLSLFDSIKQTFRHFPITLNGEKYSGRISGIQQFSEKDLLFGTSDGLFRYDILDGNLYRLSINGVESEAHNDAVRTISKDQFGRIWVVFYNKGITAFQVNKKQELESLSSLTIDSDSPRVVLSESENSILVGTVGMGIERIKLGTEKVRAKILETDGINVLNMVHDWEGRVWIATASQGIKVFSQGKEVVSFGEEEGLPNNTVYSIVPDVASNKVWATTNNGMVSINPETFKIERYNFHDGLQGDEFNRAGFRSSDGYIYFGGMKGFSRFFPNIIENKLFVHDPIITKLRIADQEKMTTISNNVSYKPTKFDASRIFLKHNQTPFDFGFTSPQFVKPTDIQFRYRLVGLNNTWITATHGIHNATYTNIGHGDYIFELQVRDVNSGWSERIERKHITVHPPYWLTKIAKLLYSLIAATIFGTIFYLNRKRRQANFLIQKTVSDSEKRLRLSLWGGGNESWDWNIKTGEVNRSSAENNIKIECSKLSRNLKELSNYVHKYDIDRVKKELNSHLSGKTEFFEAAYRIKDSKLEWRWIQDRAKIVERDEDNSPIRMSGTQSDVSEIHKKDEEIERLGQAFKTTSDGVWIRDAKWRLIECNPSYEKMTGFSFEDKQGEVLWFPDVEEQPTNMLQRIRLSLLENGSWQGEAWAERKDSEPFPQKLSIDTILDEKGLVRYYVGVFSDITFHKRAEEEFRKLSNYDTLTGLPNRACLGDRLTQTIEKARFRKEQFALFIIDIDNFKRVNDSLGHSVGDKLIAEVAQRLRLNNRSGDTIARVGGDEFVIIRDDIQSSTEVASYAEHLLKELNQPLFIKGQKLNLNFSIGITISPDDGATGERLLRNADTAMYEAKKEILNSYHFYSVELNERARKRMAMENELRIAIERDQIHLAYQPKVDMKTGRVCGMEALARWNHSKFGDVSPDEFITLAEETGLIQPLGSRLLEKAVRQAKQWVDDGIMRGRMCVNLSAHQFWHRDLVKEVGDILTDVGLEAEFLELELTESACVQEVKKTIQQMEGLRKLGVHLALDDFGTGYSSLAQLKTLPLDTLKVDKSFIHNIAHNPQDGNIVKAIIDIASSLELNVVIEGVETQEQCDYLWQYRANVIQGFFFSRPLDAKALGFMMAKQWNKSEYLSNTADNVTTFGS